VRLRDPAYPVRRAAFDEVVAAGQASPEVVARALDDPAILMRRAGAVAAGRMAHTALLRAALQDEAWAVRQSAVGAAGPALGAQGVPLLLARLREDPEPAVRLAALQALRPLAAGRSDVADAWVRALEDADAGVRAAAERALAGLPPEDALPAIARALRSETARTEPRPAALARLFVLFEKSAGWDPGYRPGMPRAEVEALVNRVALAAARVEQAVGRGRVR
jgi:HEAT repeat protein